MEINIEIEHLDEVYGRLNGIPKGAEFALRQSIKKGLATGRTAGAKAATKRYNIPYGWVLSAEGQVHMTGLGGFLHVSGSKAKLAMFPNRDIYPYGIVAAELKDGPPTNMLHAFIRKGKILEREAKGAPQYPVHNVVGLAAPQMIGQETEVYPEMQFQMEFALYTELDRLINVVLSGGITLK